MKKTLSIFILSIFIPLITVAALIPPTIRVNPEVMPHVTLEQDGVTARMLTIHNDGEEDLTFDIHIGGVPAHPTSTVAFIEIEKGAEDTRSGPPVTQGTGGPDNYGYVWVDSDETGGPTFDWIDISTTGTEITGLRDDNYVGPFDIGFDFDFYGNTQSRFYVQSNGVISFDGHYYTLGNQPIPRADGYNNMIAWMWDDLYYRIGSSRVYYQVVDGNKLVIQFVNYGEYGGSGRVDAEVILYSNGDIRIQYLEFRNGMDLESSTIGIENANGTDGLQVAFNVPYLHNNLAILFQGGASWLTADIISGTVAPGGLQDIVLTYNAEDMDVGEYESDIVVTSNDPVNSEVAVPASLTVTTDATPPAAVSDLLISEVTYEAVQLNWTAVADNGETGKPAASYDIRYSTSMITETNWDSATEVEGEPGPGEPGSVESHMISGLDPSSTYYFAMMVTGDIGLVLGLSNVVNVTLLDAPVMTINPQSISDTLAEGENSTHILTLSNTGGYSLSYDVTLSDTSSASAISSVSTYRSGDSVINNDISEMLDRAEYVPGEIIVRFVPSARGNEVAAARMNAHATIKRRIPRLNMEVWEFPSKARSELLNKLNVLSRNPNIMYAEPNYIVEAIELPNDPRFDELWGIHNTGQTLGTADADIDAPEAWDMFQGSSDVIVAVIDTGIDYNHVDLTDNTWINVGEIPDNGIDDDGNGFTDDVYGYDFAYNDSNPMDGHSHGTHCAGTIGAVGNNSTGVVGVNHSVRLMAVKFLNDFGSGSTSDAVEAVLYAVDNGADILSNSWGGGGFSSALEDAIVHAMDHDVLFVAAAGNDYADTDINPHYPSSYDIANVMSIAATDHNDLKAGFSNWGASSVDLGAPGVSILSTVPGNSYGTKNGTSMATPHVAGAAALLKGYNSSLTALDIKDILMESVDPNDSLSGRTVTGGRLNIANAIRLAGPDWIRVTGALSGEIPVAFSTELIIQFDATGMMLGDYEADIIVESSDPVNPVQTVPVVLTVLPDCCPPAAVADLHITDFGSTFIDLSWSAVGDDGYLGRASGYDIRYSTSMITEDNWDSATEVEGEPLPSDSDTQETFKLTGLLPETSYWIGMKVGDNSGQFSTLSNVVNITTLIPPTILASPETMPHVRLEQDGVTARMLTIHNDGEEDLTHLPQLKLKIQQNDRCMDGKSS